MLYIPKIDDYLKILTGDEIKDFAVINFSEYLKSTKDKLYSKLSEEQNIRKVAKSLYIFLKTPDEIEKYLQSSFPDNCIHCYNVEILNLFDPELQLSNTKSVIKNKLKKLLSELKKFKVQAILELVYIYKKRNNRKIFHSRTKLIDSDSDIEKASKHHDKN